MRCVRSIKNDNFHEPVRSNKNDEIIFVNYFVGYTDYCEKIKTPIVFNDNYHMGLDYQAAEYLSLEQAVKDHMASQKECVYDIVKRSDEKGTSYYVKTSGGRYQCQSGEYHSSNNVSFNGNFMEYCFGCQVSKQVKELKDQVKIDREPKFESGIGAQQNNKYLKINSEYLTNKKNTFVRSPMGTGKNYSILGELNKRGSKYIVVSA